MIRTFRPWQLFEKLGDNNKMELTIPTVPGTTSRTVFMLETALLIAAARIVKAKTILEIGTCMGYTAMHLAMNTEANITALDPFAKEPVWKDTEWARNIGIIKKDTKSYISIPDSRYDMVFIDADHSYEWVEHDTERALEFNPSCIAWHDFMNPMEPGTQKYLSEFAQDHNLIHVQDSWLCFWFRDDL